MTRGDSNETRDGLKTVSPHGTPHSEDRQNNAEAFSVPRPVTWSALVARGLFTIWPFGLGVVRTDIFTCVWF